MNIIYSVHARTQMERRGVTESEVVQVLTDGTVAEARQGREIKTMVFTAGYPWRGTIYPHKEVEVVHRNDAEAIIVITVKSRYGHWEVMR